jgi:hypothetical protein
LVSEEGLVKLGDVLLQIALGLLMDPLLEVVEIESIRVGDLSALEPLEVVGEVVGYLLAVKDAVDHMTAEETQLDLVTCVRMDFLVLVDGLEDVRGRRTVGELQLLEGFLSHLRFVSLLKVFDRHLSQHVPHLAVGVLEVQMRFHVLLLQQGHESLVLWGFNALLPVGLVDVGV